MICTLPTTRIFKTPVELEAGWIFSDR